MGGFEKHNDKKIGLILHETDPGAVLSLSPASRSRLRNSRFGLDFLSGHANLLTLLLPTTDEQRRNQTLRSDSPIGSRANAGSGAAEEGARGSGQDRPQGLSDAINRFPAKGILATGPRRATDAPDGNVHVRYNGGQPLSRQAGGSHPTAGGRLEVEIVNPEPLADEPKLESLRD